MLHLPNLAVNSTFTKPGLCRSSCSLVVNPVKVPDLIYFHCRILPLSDTSPFELGLTKGFATWLVAQGPTAKTEARAVHPWASSCFVIHYIIINKISWISHDFPMNFPVIPTKIPSNFHQIRHLFRSHDHPVAEASSVRCHKWGTAWLASTTSK